MNTIPEPELARIREALFRGQKIEAIKIYRESSNAGLFEAKTAVEELERELRAASPERFTAAPSGKGGLGIAVVIFVVIAAVIVFKFVRPELQQGEVGMRADVVKDTNPAPVVTAVLEGFSGIPKALNENSWFPTNEVVYKFAKRPHDSGDSYGTTSFGATIQRRMEVTLLSGQRGDLVSACRGEIRKVLSENGATLRGGNTLADRDGLRDFSEDYEWQDKIGMIRLYSVVTGKHKLTLVLFCNEHKR